MQKPVAVALSVCMVLFLVSCAREATPPEPPAAAVQPTAPAPAPVPDFGPEKGKEILAWLPAGLEPVPVPEGNPSTPEKWWLGYQLYFDKRLSKDDTVSCATCHDPQKGFADALPVSTGVGGKTGTRNSPTTLMAAYYTAQFWDGRAATLEEQAKGPIHNPVEMAMTDPEVVAKINAIPGYKEQFQVVFGRDATYDDIAAAIACFERTLLVGDTPFDRYILGDKTALTPEQERGWNLFNDKAQCNLCHSGAVFSDSDFHNLGVSWSPKKGADWGRYDVTKKDADKGKFRTPGLRNIKETAPYMHDGSQKTLAEVMDFYNKGGEKNPNLDQRVKPLNLTPEEIADIIAFMEGGLQGKTWDVKEPPLPQ